MKKSGSTDPTRRSIDRRRFLHLVTAGSAAILAGGVTPAPLPAAPAPRRGKAKSSPPAALQHELENQRKSIADMLKVIRAYDLEPGSEPAVVFRPLRARRRDR